MLSNTVVRLGLYRLFSLCLSTWPKLSNVFEKQQTRFMHDSRAIGDLLYPICKFDAHISLLVLAGLVKVCTLGLL